LKCKIKAKELI